MERDVFFPLLRLRLTVAMIVTALTPINGSAFKCYRHYFCFLVAAVINPIERLQLIFFFASFFSFESTKWQKFTEKIPFRNFKWIDYAPLLRSFHIDWISAEKIVHLINGSETRLYDVRLGFAFVLRFLFLLFLAHLLLSRSSWGSTTNKQTHRMREFEANLVKRTKSLNNNQHNHYYYSEYIILET